MSSWQKLCDAELLILTVYRHHSLLEASLSMVRPDEPENMDDVLREHAKEVAEYAKAEARKLGAQGAPRLRQERPGRARHRRLRRRARRRPDRARQPGPGLGRGLSARQRFAQGDRPVRDSRDGGLTNPRPIRGGPDMPDGSAADRPSHGLAVQTSLEDRSERDLPRMRRSVLTFGQDFARLLMTTPTMTARNLPRGAVPTAIDDR